MPELAAEPIDESVRERIGPVLRALLTRTSGLQRPNAVHRETLGPCKKHDAGRAVAVLRSQIETARKEVAACLSKTALAARSEAFGAKEIS